MLGSIDYFCNQLRSGIPPSQNACAYTWNARIPYDAWYIPIEGLWLARQWGIFLLRGCDWPDSGVYSYWGVVIGRTVGYIPIEGLWLAGQWGIFLLRGCDWPDSGVYSYWGDVIGRTVGYIPIEGLWLAGILLGAGWLSFFPLVRHLQLLLTFTLLFGGACQPPALSSCLHANIIII
jgi:hypothetical protein